MGFAQRDNEMLATVANALQERNFAYRRHTSDSGFKPGNVCEHLTLSDRANLLRFLGSIRPPRLLSKFEADRLGTFICQRNRLIRKTFVGPHPVVALETSSKTFIAEGMASHNCVFVCDYDSRGLTCITWGKLKRMTWAFWDKYCDEAYGLLNKDWIQANGEAPPGFKYEELVADMSAIA
jgi:hypothetical protein